MHNQSAFYRNPSHHTSPAKDRVIEVLGEGVISAQPDVAIIRLGVITEGVDLTETLDKNSAAMSNVIQALIGLGIPKEHIKTDEYRIDLQYDFKDGQQLFRGYRATNMIEITIHVIKKVGLVVNTAIQNGANTVSNIEFSLEKKASYYNQALEFAVKNAQEKALAIASAAGVSLNQVPFSITEMTTPRQPPIPFEATAMVQSVSTPIEPGQMEIKAQIVAKFSY
ncbi:hypothetical protein SAMN05877753_102546 [Bacillus oleivorans]|uniref:SIMPL domain-containing protein n=1 Tax=Bacillus oleivorans TaxID=1448271 RepID=A0A285CLP8_9BACI|nr:SIMPL domain-containing protein [Bacillus oleivorans]SNX68467.1 hypothetical protein SAMN05877753_102546 [Bacillus oleivorans]